MWKFSKVGILIFSFFLFLDSCGKEKVRIRAPIIKQFAPREVTVFGNVPFKITFKGYSPSSNIKLSVCKRDFYNVAVSGNMVYGYIPGCEEEGNYTVTVADRGHRWNYDGIVKFYAPFDKFNSFVAIGASYTAGFLNLGLNWLDQLHSPFAYVAEQAGAYFPQPLIKEGYFHVIFPAALKNGCEPSRLSTTYVFNLLHTIEKLRTSKGFYLSSGRIDPYLIPYNLAVGAARLTDSLWGAAKSNNPLVGVLEHLVYFPEVDIWEAMSDPPQGSPFNVALSVNPRYILTVDLFANDLLYWHFAQLFNMPLSPGITPEEKLKEDLEQFFEITHKKGIKVFISDLPDITVLPAIKALKNYLTNIGFDKVKINEELYNLQDDTVKYNKIFYSLALKFDNVYPVPFSKEVERISRGVTIAGQRYDLDFLGGLIGLDGIHPTWTGYALIGNLFIRRINKVLGLNIPEVDIEKIAEVDPLSPWELRKVVDIDLCRKEFYSGK